MSKDNSDFFVEKNVWSTIKDNLLKGYLTPYFQKILKTMKQTYYVDCFAGKGKYDKGDDNDGSPFIAIAARNYVLTTTKRKDATSAIDLCFIESKFADDLKKNVESYRDKTIGNEPEVIHGKFEKLIKNCLRDKSDQNVFLYIDPFGIKQLDMNLFDELRSHNFYTFEMLINFNSFGFFRDCCQVLSVDVSKDPAFMELDDVLEYETIINSDPWTENRLNKIAGGDYWKSIVFDYKQEKIDGFAAEKRLSYEFKNRLKQSFKYVLDMPIRFKPEQRPKYRMVHVCNHEDGCYLMAENMQRRKNELFLNVHNDGQMHMSDILESEVSQTTEGDYLTRTDIKEMLNDYFVKNNISELRIKPFIAGFCNEYGLICEYYGAAEPPFRCGVSRLSGTG